MSIIISNVIKNKMNETRIERKPLKSNSKQIYQNSGYLKAFKRRIKIKKSSVNIVNVIPLFLILLKAINIYTMVIQYTKSCGLFKRSRLRSSF